MFNEQSKWHTIHWWKMHQYHWKISLWGTEILLLHSTILPEVIKFIYVLKLFNTYSLQCTSEVQIIIPDTKYEKGEEIMLLFHLLYFEVFTCGNLNAINKHVKQTKPIQLILLIISCFVHLFWLYNFLIYFSYYTYTLFLYFYTYILFLLYNDLYFRLAPSSNMPNGTQAFSLWLPFFSLPSVFFFFLTVCPLSQIHHNFWRGKHLAPLGCYTLFPLQTKIIPKSSSQNTNQPLVSLWIMYFELQMFGSTYINRIYPFFLK